MTVRDRETRPVPTVRPPQSRAAARLAQASTVPLALGVCGGTLAMIAHRNALAVLLGGLGAALAIPLAAAAALLHARRHRFNPWPALLAAAALATALAWLALPALGLGILRIPLLLAAGIPLYRSGTLAIRHHRRTREWHRWAQTLSPVLAQGIGQHEQVLAALAGNAHSERITAPHYGAAPGAAWELIVREWAGTRIRVAALRLPAHDDIRTPDFLAKIKDALIRRTDAKYLSLSVATRRDEITITVLDAPEDDGEPEQDRQALAVAAAEQAAGDWLKGVKVKVVRWQEYDPEEPEDSGPAYLLQEFVVTFDHNPQLTLPQNKDRLKYHMGAQLYNDPAILRADWNLPQNRVVFRKRASFPAIVPFRPADTRPLFGDLTVVMYGITEDNARAYLQLSDTDAPHVLVTGGTGTGKSVLLRVVALEAARLGLEVRGCDPKRVEMRGWRGWPNITQVASRVPDMIRLIESTYAEMHQRYTEIEEGRARQEDYRRVLLIIDEYLMFGMLVNDYWAEERVRLGGSQPKEHPVMRKIRGLVVMARGAIMNLIFATQRGDADIFPEGVRDSIGARVAMGRQTKESAIMTFGDAQVGRDVPLGARGVGTALTPAGPERVKVGWLPDPADWNDPKHPLEAEDRQLLAAMLPPGAEWDGPLPFQAPDPGFEDTSPDSEQAAGKPHVRLLYLARAAMLTRGAHLTDGTTGGAPASGDLAAHYGWHPGADGTLKPSGTWIGCAAGQPGNRRVYLYPQRVLKVVEELAASLNVPWPFKRADVDAALRSAGLLREETSGGERRYTVLRPVPGNDLDGKDRRQRVWDIAEGELIGDVLDEEPETAPPARPDAARPAAAPAQSRPALGMPHPETREPAPARPQWKRACDLEEGDRILLEFAGGDTIAVTFYFLDDDTKTPPEDDGVPRIILNYIDDNREPGFVRCRADHPIRLEPPATAEENRP